MASKQDSNLTGLSIAEELALGTLPSSPHWLQMEPNGYPEFGSEISKVARDTINPTRKRLKGGVTDVDASAAFDHDLVPVWLLRVMRGFFFTSGDGAGTTDPLNIAARAAISDVDGTTDTVTLGASLTGVCIARSLVVLDGFSNSANNTFTRVASVSGNEYTLEASLEDESSPPTAARMRVVGHQWEAGDLSVALSGDLLIMSNSGTAFTAFNIKIGDTIFIGGDASSDQFETLGTGYARVVSVSTTSLVLTDFTGTAASDDGTGQTVQIFFPTVGLRDEPDEDDIVRRSYQLERTLGDDEEGTQAEYIKGAVPAQMNINLPEADKITTSFSFTGMDRETQDGSETLKSGALGATKYSAESEDFVNTSTDIYVARLIKSSGQTSLVSYIENVDLTIDNGITPNKAVGVVGAFEFSAGDFEVNGSVSAYFDTVAAMDAIRENVDVSLQIIGARNNSGFAIALPLVTLSGGQAQVEADAPIKLPLDLMAAGVVGGVTCAYDYFAYLPDAAMPE